MVARVGGLDPEHDWPDALSAEENRLLAIARVLLAAPRFVFLDRMDGDLTPDQIDHVYEVFTESRISYLTVGEHTSLHAHHDVTLSLRSDGSWQLDGRLLVKRLSSRTAAGPLRALEANLRIAR